MTPERALTLSRAYLAIDKPEARVVGLREDDVDFVVRWEQDVDELGPGILMLNKATGLFRWEASAEGGEIGRRTTPVEL